MKYRKLGKKLVATLMLASTIVTCSGCGNTVLKVEAKQPTGDIYTDFYELCRKQEEIGIDFDFLKNVQQFSNESAFQLLQNTTENIAYSPISLYLALSVMTEGSDGNTAKELFQTLGIDEVDYDYLANKIDQLYRLLYCDTDVKTVKIANAVWMDENFDFLPSYSDAISNLYHASIYREDFEDERTATVMEDWIAKSVNNVMAPKVNISEYQVMTIMNTIYYSNHWNDLFYKDATKEDTFYPTKDENVTCDFMNRTIDCGSYVDGEGYKAYELPLENGDSMIFCLPDEGVDVNDLLTSGTSVQTLFDARKTKEAKIILSIPKFVYGCKLELVEMLKKLGIQDAFDQTNANFARMSEKDLFLDKATQDVHITIDEEGVVGAAYTELEMKCGCAMLPEELETVELIYNRPFLYQIVTSNDVPLFTGIVQNPTAK